MHVLDAFRRSAAVTDVGDAESFHDVLRLVRKLITGVKQSFRANYASSGSVSAR